MNPSWFAAGGPAARALDQFEDRPEQRAMADAVADALQSGISLMVEAGTGTGKTLAYLLPAATSGKRVVISTGTRALQEQLLRSDLPLAEAVLGRPIHHAVLKGVSNYLCKRRASRLEILPGTATDDESIIRDWMYRTEVGDRAELGELGETSPLWAELTVSADNRLGPRCPHFESCFVTQARRRAERADILIVNHHLFFADLLVRQHSGGKVLPDYDAVIFDEAHLLEDVMTEHLGFSVSAVRIAQLMRDLDHLGIAIDRIEAASRQLFAAVANELRALSPDGGRVALPDGLFADPDLQEHWFAVDAALETAQLSAAAEASRLEASGDDGESFSLAADRSGQLRRALADIAEPDPGSGGDLVRWGEVRGRHTSLRASPIDVSRVMRDSVLPRVESAVLTSATLTSTGSFQYLRARLGLGVEECEELRLDSPFDYRSQALLYCARDLPVPSDAGFGPAARARIAELCAITGGHAFVLFTSHRALQEAAAELPAVLDCPVLVQGQAPARALVERFRQTPGCVLLGTGTFWAGVDVPGQALSLVIIDKLPFASPSDPVGAARAKLIGSRGGDPFRDYALPQAALTLRQGFGRLIRRKDDRGIVAVLDPRLLERSYGRAFVRSLPADLPRTATLEVARRFWLGQPAAEAPAEASA